MSKVLIFSDIHIHPHKRSTERLQDCLDVLDWVFKTAVERKIENVLFLGDLFHDRQRIDVLTYSKTFEVFEKYFTSNARPFDVYLLLGNHDLWHLQKWDVSSVIPLRALPGVHVIDRPCTMTIKTFNGGYDVSFLPYTHNPIDDLKLIVNNSKSKVLCGHVAIDGAVWNVMAGTKAEVSIEHDGDMVKVNSNIFNGWDHVFLGHYHAQQKLDYNVEYIGSPLQLSFGEAFQHKHILIFDLDIHEKEYVRNTFSPQHFIIPESDISKYDLEHNFVTILVDDISAAKVVEIRNDLIKSHHVGSCEIKQIQKKIEDEQILIEDAKSILSNEKEMLEKYVEQQEKINGLNLHKNKLLEIGSKICETTNGK